MRRLFAAIPIVALAYVLVVQPVLDRMAPGSPITTHTVWPALFAMTLLLALACWRDLDLARLTKAPVALLALFLCFAGASILWAYSPPEAAKRWLQALMIVVTIILPITLKRQPPDIVTGIFWCYFAATVTNGVFVLTTPPMLTWQGDVLGHPGYFSHKQYLGMCASIAVLVSAYMLLFGHRRAFAIVAIGISLWLISASESKTSLGFAMLAPLAALAATYASRIAKRPAVWFVSAVPILYMGLGLFVINLSQRISYRIYGDSTFTGRVFIWDFIETHTALRPWLGWGFHSYWAVPNSPSQMAPGFVRDMPSAHSGYLDMRLELGHFGLWLFLAFLVATLYSLEHIRRAEPSRAMLFLSIFIYILLMNLLETLWFIPFDPLWILFLLVTAEVVRQGAAEVERPISVVEPARARVHRYPHSTVGVVLGAAAASDRALSEQRR